MSSHETPRPPESAASPAAPYLDFGPELPARYPGSRARAMVASPTRVRLTWDFEGDGGTSFRATAFRAPDEPLGALDVPAGGDEAWLSVPPETDGFVRLEAVLSDGTTRPLAEVPFRTPAATPADLAPEERWVLVGSNGAPRPTAPPPGRPLDPEPVPPLAGYGSGLRR